ncbi:MAG: tetratricopeptide repeat protein [Planctomycetes bacterium]|nr:tetratricopeptide repeat protein [Planctomycetota bacterium]
MQRSLVLCLCAVVVSGLPGCIAVSSNRCPPPSPGADAVIDDLNVRAGDTHMLQDEYSQALDRYVSAQTLHPDLNACPAFRNRVNRAKAMIAYQKGNTFRNARNWDEAIRCYNEALSMDPKCDVAASAREATLLQASTACYDAATSSMVAGEVAKTVGLLQQALNYNPNNEQAASLLETLNAKFEASVGGPGAPAPMTPQGSDGP